MTIYPNNPQVPCPHGYKDFPGMYQRDWIAVMMAQALLQRSFVSTPATVAVVAYEHADALIQESKIDPPEH